MGTDMINSMNSKGQTFPKARIMSTSTINARDSFEATPSTHLYRVGSDKQEFTLAFHTVLTAKMMQSSEKLEPIVSI
jgi:hypothetical protein